MLIDHQAHWHPPRYLRGILDRDRYPRAYRDADGTGYALELAPGDVWRFPAAWLDLDRQLDAMVAHGIDAMVSSPTMMALVDELDAEEAVETLELLNEETAAAQRAHPDRFIGLAMLPLGHAARALPVLERAVAVHELRGVCLLSNIGGRTIVDDDTRVVLARVADLGLPVFLHPAHRSMTYGAGLPAGIERGVSWMFDTTAAALSLIAGGLLDDCPELVIVHPHLGGVLPYVIDRAQGNMRMPVRDYLRRSFYVDTASRTPAALDAAAVVYGADRILFATDDPWRPRSEQLEFVRQAPAALAERILQHNHLPGLTSRTTTTSADARSSG